MGKREEEESQYHSLPYPFLDLTPLSRSLQPADILFLVPRVTSPAPPVVVAPGLVHEVLEPEPEPEPMGFCALDVAPNTELQPPLTQPPLPPASAPAFLPPHPSSCTLPQEGTLHAVGSSGALPLPMARPPMQSESTIDAASADGTAASTAVVSLVQRELQAAMAAASKPELDWGARLRQGEVLFEEVTDLHPSLSGSNHDI